MPLIIEPIKEVPEFVSNQLEQTVEHTNDIDKSDLVTILIAMFILYMLYCFIKAYAKWIGLFIVCLFIWQFIK